MKTKLLKKVRRRYAWRWDKDLDVWTVSDQVRKTVDKYGTATDFTVMLAYKFIGLQTGWKYESRTHSRKRYRACLEDREAIRALDLRDHGRFLRPTQESAVDERNRALCGEILQLKGHNRELRRVNDILRQHLRDERAEASSAWWAHHEINVALARELVALRSQIAEK